MIMFRRIALALCAVTPLTSFGQAPPAGPVVPPRGVINAFTQQPAPSSVAPGGLIWIQGLNLGPADGLKAPSTPWPTKLGDFEVLINGRLSPVGFISPGKIVAQVPFEIAAGVAQVVVRSNGVTSRPARFQVTANLQPSVRSAGDRGYGDPPVLNDSTLTLAVSGIGNSDPAVKTGEAGPADSPVPPKATVQAFIGGLPANTTATLASDRVGEYDVKVDIPAGAAPGDLITVLANNRASNRLTYKRTANADLAWIPFPDGTPEIRDILSTDLRGSFLLATAARDAAGCYAGYAIDAAKKTFTPVDPCLTAANANAPTPVVAGTEVPVIAALVGPPTGDAASGVSSIVKLFSPLLSAPMAVQLPSPASVLIGSAAGDFSVLIPGTPPSGYSIDSSTGDVQPITNLAGLAGGGGGGIPAGLGAAPLSVDLGNGLKVVVSARTALGQGVFVVVVADDENKPTAAKVAVLNNQNEATGSRDFPDGWLPLVAPAAPAATGPGGAAAGRNPAATLRATTLYDAPTRLFYVLARKADDSAQGLVTFPADGSAAKVAPFPDGWFVASCTATTRTFQLPLSRTLGLFGTKSVESTFKNPCTALGFLITDLATQKISAIPIQGDGQMNATANAGDMNDYIYATNTARPNADTLFVLDGVSGQSLRFDPPSGVGGFTNITEVPELGLLVGLGSTQGSRVAGDAGFVLFDIEQSQTRILPTPDGFANVQLLAIFNATRKLVAKGNKTGGAGSQYLIYDLVTGDLLMPPNPDGVAFVGGVPAAAPMPGQTPVAAPTAQRANTKANTVEAIGYGSDRKQLGVLVLRVP